MFLQVSVILFTGGVPGLGGVCALGGAWSLGVHGLGVSAPGGAWSQGGCLVEIPLTATPGGCLVPGGVCWTPHPPMGYCCGRYASYWNAFLLKINVHNFGCTIYSFFLSTLRPFCCRWPLCKTNKDPTNRS